MLISSIIEGSALSRIIFWALIINPATLPTDHDILRITD
jgi:hypothetical protein